MKYLLLVGAIACFGSFAWAMAKLFIKPEGTTPFARTLSLCALICLLCQLTTIILSHASVISTAVGFILYCVAFATFWSSVHATRTQPLSFAGSSDAPEHLLQTGPYRWIRHPFYTSYLLAWIAGVIGTEHGWLSLTVGVMGSFYWISARQEEAKFANGNFRDAYERYIRSTGMFMPKISRSK